MKKEHIKEAFNIIKSLKTTPINHNFIATPPRPELSAYEPDRVRIGKLIVRARKLIKKTKEKK